MIDVFRYSSNLDFCTVEYEDWFSNPAANIEELQKFLDLQCQSESDLALLLSDIIDPTGRQDAGHRQASQPLVRTLYELTNRTGQAGLCDQIAFIISQCLGFQQSQRLFLLVFEDVTKAAPKYSEIEWEMTAFGAAISERHAAVETADARAASVEGRLAEALAGERDERAEIEPAASGLRATVAERKTTLAELWYGADELQLVASGAAARKAPLRHVQQVARERRCSGGDAGEVGALRKVWTRSG
jgi:hypothetical protein